MKKVVILFAVVFSFAYCTPSQTSTGTSGTTRSTTDTATTNRTDSTRQ